MAFITNASGGLVRRFTYDAAGRPMIMAQDGQAYYYQLNAHGDVVRMVDTAGNTVASYEYDAWGNILSQSGSMAAVNLYRYAGYWFDQESGMYYLKARYYRAEQSLL